MANKPQDNLGKLQLGPSNHLIATFRACSRDPTKAIKDRLTSMLQTFLQHHKDSAGNKPNVLAVKCCCEAVIWFYKILEHHASEESNRLGINDISVFFENHLFQRCLLACCLEVTISSNQLPCDIILLLQILKLSPYQFWKVIELVLRAKVGLPHSVFSHLAQVEEKVLKSLAWSRESPLWEDIQTNGGLPTCQEVMPQTQLEESKLTNLTEGNLPGVGLSLGGEQSDDPELQHSSAAVNNPQKKKSLHLFARKVYTLMGKRLRELCSTLHIADDLRLKIWTCFEHSLVHCTDLMIDRHLDQLLMCAIYIIAKITDGEITFKHIMTCYKFQPLASKSVCKNVLISGGDKEKSPKGNNYKRHQSSAHLTPDTPSAHSAEERGNLIYFYNQVYMIKMQHFAQQFGPTAKGVTPPLSPYPGQWKSSPSRQRLSSSHSIYISPFNTETTSLRTPGLCYYFNSSSPERLCEINNMIKTAISPTKRSYLVSVDREKEGGHDSPSVKRCCSDDQSVLQRLLMKVVDDRATGRDQKHSSTVVRPNLP
ncbi:retinoblastoma-like protein 2 [Antennarius striatus]|uniref:retinoblastoma-like protein 2 n=1 Tax=Antennarius striatus TaxID=241820 RepID=UPI0035B277B5